MLARCGHVPRFSIVSPHGLCWVATSSPVPIGNTLPPVTRQLSPQQKASRRPRAKPESTVTCAMLPTDRASKPVARDQQSRQGHGGDGEPSHGTERMRGAGSLPTTAPKSQGCCAMHRGAKDPPSGWRCSGTGQGCSQLPSPAGLSSDGRELQRVGEKTARALTQHHRPPPQGQMQLAACAALPFP